MNRKGRNPEGQRREGNRRETQLGLIRHDETGNKTEHNTHETRYLQSKIGSDMQHKNQTKTCETDNRTLNMQT